jgi:hypothetical protein
MINARSLVISISWAVLSAVPLICAQDVKTSEAGVSLQRPVAIQELQLQSQRFLNLPIQVDAVSVPSIQAQDLSRYRQFQLGMNLLAVAKQADLQLSEARVIHQRPAVIQELEWRPQGSLASSGPNQTRFRRSSSPSTTASFFEWWSITTSTGLKG